MKVSAAAVTAAVTVTAFGCGYVDDNGRAAAVVAQEYLDGYAERDASDICRVLAPDVQAMQAERSPSGTCEDGVRAELTRSYPRLTVGRTRDAGDSPGGNPQFLVEVPGEPGRWIKLERHASIWRVADGGALRAT